MPEIVRSAWRAIPAVGTPWWTDRRTTWPDRTAAARPEALAPQLDSAQSVLAALAQAQHTLGAAAAGARRRAEQAVSTRDRVSATIAAHRAEAALDDVLSGAWERMSALMKERGLR